MILRDMPAPKGDPAYIKNKEKYFMSLAKAVAVVLLIQQYLEAVY